MKRKIITGILATLLLAGGITLFAQDGPGRGGKGRGHGGPPQTEQERAARQAACAEKNGGVCPNGGPRTNCPGRGPGQGQGGRHGLRDGTGPRNANGNCPVAGEKPAQN